MLTPDITPYKFDHILPEKSSSFFGIMNSDKSKAIEFKNDDERAKAILTNLTQAQKKSC